MAFHRIHFLANETPSSKSLNHFKTKNVGRFNKIQKSISRQIEANPLRESESYFFQYLNQKRYHGFLMQQSSKAEAQQQFLQATAALDNYYFIELLQAATTIAYQHGPDKTEEHLPMMQAVIEAIDKEPARFPPLVQLWYNSFLLTQNPREPRLYAKLKEALFAYQHDIPAVDARSFTVLLKAALKAQDGLTRRHYLEEIFSINEVELARGWLLADGVLSYIAYINLTLCCLALGKVAFARDFVESHKRFLIPEVQESLYTLNIACIAFAEHDFKKCLSRCLRVEYLETRVTLGVKRLQLMSFFELGDSDMLLHGINAFAVYLHRMEKEPLLKKRSSDFLHLLRFLEKSIPGATEAGDKAKYMQFLQQDPFAVEREWLEAKLAAL
jgi:hypothetical protein